MSLFLQLFLFMLSGGAFWSAFSENRGVHSGAAQRHAFPAITAHKPKRFFITMALTSQNRCVTLHVTDLRRTFKIGR
ncbi:hypothetical protein, partial [Pseudomonas syringae group genomosp. 3]|uniref:hypothetical protein n=1 Tax=Pseudomonas syringae group genomosp. 3 TaxID=251701 RepID=UPI001C7F8E04